MGMHNLFLFYVRCAQHAWKGSWGRANTFGAVFGAAILALAAYSLGLTMDAPSSIQGTIAFGAGFGIASIAAAWILIYITRFVAAPAHLYNELELRIRGLIQSDIAIQLHDGIVWEGGFIDSEGKELPAMRAFAVRITNCGAKSLKDCQVFFTDGNVHQPVTGYFDLRIGEHTDQSVLRITGNEPSRAIACFIKGREGKLYQGGSGWLPPVGEYRLEVISADTNPAVLGVKLTNDDGWKLDILKPDAIQLQRG